MPISQTTVRHIVRDLAGRRCVELFKAYGVDLIPIAAGAATATPLLHCGVIGYSGPGIKGSLAIAGSRSVLGASNPLPDGGSRDWAGELANQLMGHVKNRLLAHELEVYFSTPTVLRGEHLALVTHSEAAPQLFALATEPGLVGIWVDIEITPEFHMTLEEDVTLAGLESGQALLF
jgi:hypothetical protein